MRKNPFTILAGLVILALGIGAALTIFNIGIPFVFSSSFVFQSLVAVLLFSIGARNLIYSRHFFAYFLTFSGILLFAYAITTHILAPGAIDVSPWAIAGPSALLSVGCILLFPNQRNWDKHWQRNNWKNGDWSGPKAHPHQNNFREGTQSTTLDTIAVKDSFNSNTHIVLSQNFQGGFVSTSFAGTTVNLAKANTTEQSITLNVSVSFAELTIIVPRHWNVDSQLVTNAFSGYSETDVQNDISGAPTLYITGSCSFGSTNIVQQ